AIFGWDAPVAQSFDVHQQRWRLHQIDRPGVALALRPTTLGSVVVEAVLTGRPTGGPLEDHEGPPGGTHRLAPTDRVRRLVIGPAGEPGEEPSVREGDALASRIRAFPHDPALRAAYAEWLALRGFARECAYLQEITAVMALLEG